MFDFDKAEDRALWRVVEGAMANPFTTSTRSNFFPPTRHFIGTAELPDDTQAHDELTVMVESPEFAVQSGAYNIFISGGTDEDKVCAALMDAATDTILWKATGNGSNNFGKTRENWSKFLGKRVRLRVVDQSKEPWGHINFGGLYGLGIEKNAVIQVGSVRNPSGR
ncbi:MAG: hypothetical protein R6V12_16910 [Candidatus Hydrogenedentota bacterium]